MKIEFKNKVLRLDSQSIINNEYKIYSSKNMLDELFFFSKLNLFVKYHVKIKFLTFRNIPFVSSPNV